MKLTEDTIKRCRIFQITPDVEKRFIPISTELLHFFYEAVAVDFNLYLKLDNHLIVEFVTQEEFHTSYVDQMQTALATKSGGRIRVLIRKIDRGKFYNFLDRVRRQKLQKLLVQYPDLDRRTLHIFDQLSSASQSIIEGGLDAHVVERARRSAAFLIGNTLDSESAIYTISKMLQTDATLYDHSATVAMLAAIVADGFKKFELTRDQLITIAECGLYHDVGKTCIPSEVLNKPGEFTPEEYEVMKTHTTHGELFLHNQKRLGRDIKDEVIRVAGEHHENFCGTGYPKKKCGRLEETPNGIHLYTRIVTIADVYSALLMKRCYKEAFDPVKSIRIMVDEGSKYDPELFRQFVVTTIKGINRQSSRKPNGRVLVFEGNKLKEARKVG